jgi:DNA repair exonuclease SbcCD ATPase subunit
MGYMMKCTIKDVVDFYNSYPDEIGQLDVRTQFGYKTIEFADVTAYDSAVMQVTTVNNKLIECSPNHLLLSDDKWVETYKLDLSSSIKTTTGYEQIQTLRKLDLVEDLYDLQVADVHEFYANDIVSHNSTILQTLSYALYGQAISNIKKDNLINRTNGKNMLVTVEFEKDGIIYRIERGRRPGILKLYKGDTAFEAKDDDAQGDSRETQHEINKILDMSHDMFRHIVALNTYTEPFLRLKVSEQRSIIEQLLGITALSEKAELIKEQVKKSKDLITSEEYRISATVEANKKIDEQIESLKRRQQSWQAKHNTEINALSIELEELIKVDIDAELTSHQLLNEYNQKKKDITDLDIALSRAQKDLDREEKGLTKLLPEIENLMNHKCHSCGQDIHNTTQEQLLSSKISLLEEHQSKSKEHTLYISEVKEGLNSIGVLCAKPKTYYNKVEEATHHKTTVSHLQRQLEDKVSTDNPFSEQITEMETTALAEVNYQIINDTTKLKDHQEFLLKLLTNKDSFIRKRIIDQNLTYLNSRLSHYLDKMGLPHTVVFENDLSVTIEELGRDLDFDNCSRGEATRIIISLSLAFRDVYESLYQPINLLMIDEILDGGLDPNGVENAMGILKRMARDTFKGIWLISHRDELTSRVGNILRVVKSGGFTSWIDTDETLERDK